MQSSVFRGRTLAAQGLIRDITPLSTAYFADERPTEFLVGTTDWVYVEGYRALAH
jgi:hypothetical protein